jgi:hypothetical protein
VKKGDMLKVLERHKMLILALGREITQAEAARELRLSLPYTKKLIKRLKEAEGGTRLCSTGAIILLQRGCLRI